MEKNDEVFVMNGWISLLNSNSLLGLKTLKLGLPHYSIPLKIPENSHTIFPHNQKAAKLLNTAPVHQTSLTEGK